MAFRITYNRHKKIIEAANVKLQADDLIRLGEDSINGECYKVKGVDNLSVKLIPQSNDKKSCEIDAYRLSSELVFAGEAFYLPVIFSYVIRPYEQLRFKFKNKNIIERINTYKSVEKSKQMLESRDKVTWKFLDKQYPQSTLDYGKYLCVVTKECAQWNLKDFIAVHGLDMIYTLIKQVFLGIWEMQELMEMFHLDLHLNNILVMENSTPGYYVFKLTDEKKYKHYIPEVITILWDFGESVKWKERGSCRTKLFMRYKYFFREFTQKHGKTIYLNLGKASFRKYYKAYDVWLFCTAIKRETKIDMLDDIISACRKDILDHMIQVEPNAKPAFNLMETIEKMLSMEPKMDDKKFYVIKEVS